MKNINDVLSKINEYWAPGIVGEFNDSFIKVAKIKGEFVYHNHTNSDEVFIILKGEIKMEFEQETLTLQEGDVYTVKKDVYHKPYCEEEAHIMIIELKDTAHTGDVKSELTKSLDEQKGY